MKITIDINAPMPILDEMLASLKAKLAANTCSAGFAIGGSAGEMHVRIIRAQIETLEDAIKNLRAGNHFIGTMSEPRPAFEAQEEVEPEESTGGPTFKWPSEFALGLGFDPSETTD